ncbi:RNA-dependent RNA polymerase [Wuhan House Fly Virus 1]|uniref:Replicase n=1 Tax=Wuhan House Fly Virus 1 TaxID=1608104 RepID=A0A0B5KXL1_9RHAB|nr:RNA-dependent RNA polymerase [Wuhan House Fly Virus 1]AJG39168.1 RNA-dependent RNA polymerase [Wuhan House Fly Virus 1]
MEFDQNYCDDIIEETNQQIWEDDESLASTFLDQPSMEYLNNVDYSLNSPLVPDKLDAFFEYLKYGLENPRWDAGSWKRMKFIIHNEQSGLSVDKASELHRWFGKFNLDAAVVNHKTKMFLQKCLSDANETIEVTNAFLHSWLKKESKLSHTMPQSPDFLRWGTLFLETHDIVLLLNASNSAEKEALCQRSQGGVIKDGDDIVGHYINLLSCKKIIISGDLIFFATFGVVIDRNFLLMMKDVYAARFQTFWALEDRVDCKFNRYDSDIMSQVYKTGDKYLSLVGDRAYEFIKLLEPACNLKLTELARTFRPLIPEFPSFKEHIIKSIQEKSIALSLDSTLFEIIQNQTSVEVILTIFGSFRQWGHPFIDTVSGLEKLYQQVNSDKDIDTEYANVLASDLTYMILKDQHTKKKKWFVDDTQVPVDSLLYPHILHNTWPTPHIIEQFGDHWHELPIIKCFDIPDVIDPSLIYSDKSHSVTRSELKEHIAKSPYKPVSNPKVLKSLLTKPATDWPSFLESIDKYGLDLEYLIIGLKEKEREIKKDGRFFSLMSWQLRDYFVITEYLIKQHFVPLFDGLTMADDLTTVIKKMMDNANGQGLDTYDYISIANHIDYEKWNNHQRKESTTPVFKVMGQFLGYPNLISRTHEFFERSLIYHGGRTDLMRIVNGEVENNSDIRVCWNGQKGGLEGLRQKGWSILNLLLIKREGSSRNTSIKTLAQGDNQVICTQYRLQKYRTQEEMVERIQKIVQNNQAIISNIENGTRRLGLIINKDETMQSADFLSYGKVPVFRGTIRNLETKRWSRVMCTTNDQIPTQANVLATVTTNALTVAHYAEGPINSMFHYNVIGNFARNLINIHNPALRCEVGTILVQPNQLTRLSYKIASLYLDPCLGGIGGMSLTRFLIRQFPDPVCESLTFLKMVYAGTKNTAIRGACIEMGMNPLRFSSSSDFAKLIENPLSLNIPRGISALTMIKNAVREQLVSNSSEIENKIIKVAVEYMASNNDEMNAFLSAIQPVFPRFISEFKSATYLGITESLVGLFQNSKTIRNLFRRRLARTLDEVIIKSELISYCTLFKYDKLNKGSQIWDCSASHADLLRLTSWGMHILGATVPHPAEMIQTFVRADPSCHLCVDLSQSSQFISLIIPRGLYKYLDHRGPYPAYLGSATLESTSVVQPWEKTTNIPLIERASRLRNSIGWFIDPSSTLADAIYGNLKALTGEDWDNLTKGFKRTGSALHRFSCSRQSTGGFAAQSPAKLTRIMTTTSTLQELGDVNYDFMFQSCILYAQMTAGEIHDQNPDHAFFHFHVHCSACLREIEEPTLEAKRQIIFPDVSAVLNNWKPSTSSWSKTRPIYNVEISDWNILSLFDKSFNIGRAEGFLYGDKLGSKRVAVAEGTLFPLTIAKKVNPSAYMDGLLDGIIRASGVNSLFRWSITQLTDPRHALIGGVLYIIDRICLDPALQNIFRAPSFLTLLSSVPHAIPPSYPLREYDLGLLGKNYLEYKYISSGNYNHSLYYVSKTPWIFSDINDLTTIGTLGLSSFIVSLLYKKQLTSQDKGQLREYKSLTTTLKASPEDISIEHLHQFLFNLKFTDREVRHAAKDLETLVDRTNSSTYSHTVKWGPECVGEISTIELAFSENEVYLNDRIQIPQIQNPLISGLRLVQLATGSHYKIRSIIKGLEIKFSDTLCAGDGSGGVGSMTLRLNPRSRLIFNSLLELEGVNLRGSNPAPPSAIAMLPNIANRCVNLHTCWNNPSDLSKTGTWTYFAELKIKYHLHLDLGIFDMECREDDMFLSILSRIKEFSSLLFQKKCVIIFKTYAHILLSELSPITHLAPYFEFITLSHTEFTSSHSSEIYIIFRNLKSKPDKCLYPDWGRIQPWIATLPVFQDEQTEFQRALQLKKYNMIKGVPPFFLPDASIELIHMLVKNGALSGSSAIIANLILSRREGEKNISLVLASLILVLESIIQTTRPFRSKPRPLSDDQVLSVGSLMIGFSLFISYTTENLGLYHYAHELLHKGFNLDWGHRKIGQYFYVWIPGCTGPSKHLYLDNKMANIGQIIRCLVRIFPKNLTTCTVSDIDQILNQINKGLRYENFNRSTGLLDVFD